MSTAELLQIVGGLVSGLVVVNELLKQIKEWRGGSPELRLLQDTVKGTQNNHTRLLETIVNRLERQ